MTDQQRLEQLRLAYQNLLIGKSARVIQKDGRRVEYSPADKQSLLNEIQRLESSAGQSRRRGPAGVI
ncbi:gpW family head-tail joining protein [Vibrio parahaemolyticus]|uniref:gpW family head-tail joining protein n=1 Tax=Vibrio parahaemolyticus TaxID=670 RepID=UPI0022403081|nr:gpW family head-tail joining protein [Vibrio parahaemolyticus]MDL1992975.1 gpW family protein [Vibrio parahaemolyticus]